MTEMVKVSGLLEPDSGSIHIDGIDAVRSSIEARARLGYMPEGVPLYREMRVFEYLRHRGALKNVDDVADAVDRSLELAGVDDARRRIEAAIWQLRDQSPIPVAMAPPTSRAAPTRWSSMPTISPS